MARLLYQMIVRKFNYGTYNDVPGKSQFPGIDNINQITGWS